ncbi:hypothetical protein CMI41_00400 [Candidatus Pacearchaeota archaeon]|nr:hypothetical protein [Candidatus Pacearchaeota archaeon]|tara:strand:- start:12093 stop:12569 length:477 start_codon:yes stop_codon:yes gene_type:complete
MKEGLTIRKSEIGDVNAIQDLNQQLFNNEISNFDDTLDGEWPANNKKYFEDAINDENGLVLVAVDGDNIIGYLIGGIKEAGDYRNIQNILEIGNTFVIEEYRRMGIGKEMVEKLLDFARLKGVGRSKVLVSSSNEAAIKFYKKMGLMEYDLVLEGDIK